MVSGKNNFALALDFGGTKLAAGIIDLQAGRVIVQRRLPTDSQAARYNLNRIIEVGKELLQQVDLDILAGVGISFGGPIAPDRRQIARSMHIPGWEGIGLPALITQAFQLPAVMDNDANLAALGEWRFGAGQGTTHMLYIQVSTGIGAGLILDGRLYRGTGMAGEFGHLTVMVDGPLCSCGKRGCVESFAAGWAIARDGRQAVLDQGDKTLLYSQVEGISDLVTARHVVEAAKAGDQVSQAIISQAFSFLGIGIANAINLLGPELVVIGGGVAKAGDLILKPITNALDDHLFPSLSRPHLKFSVLGDETPLFGAAALVEQELN
jgi:glucokinase